MPSLLNGPPIFSPILPMAPPGLNCLPIAPSEEMIDGFYDRLLACITLWKRDMMAKVSSTPCGIGFVDFLAPNLSAMAVVLSVMV